MLLGSLALAITLALNAYCGELPAQPFKLRDFPPSPFEPRFAASAWPKEDPVVDSIEREVKLRPATTNEAEVALIEEIKELRGRILDLEAGADLADPWLRISDNYVETAHDWVMKNHWREFGAANRYFSSPAPTPAAQRARNHVTDLVDMALFRDLAGNTNFAPWFKAFFDESERHVPGEFSRSYARNDSLNWFSIGWRSQTGAHFRSVLCRNRETV